MSISVVILAAGQGTRMKSNIAKVMHPVGGKPMVIRAVETAARLSHQTPIVVVGHGAEAVQSAVGGRAQFVIQAQQQGTGHAVMQADSALRGKADYIAVFYADMPLLRSASLQRLIDAQLDNRGPITLLTIVAQDPRGFGRIVRGSDGSVISIVEEADCTPDQLLIRELNAGVYVFRADWLWDNLAHLTPKGSKNEYYLTDMIQLAASQALPIVGLESDDSDEVIGVNTLVHLSEAETALRQRVNRGWMLEGVTIIDPATTYIHEDVRIGKDSVIQPNTHLQGKTLIGSQCNIGPNSIIRESTLGSSCTVTGSVIENAILENHVEIGPFAHLRAGAYLADNVHMGNFGEVKNSRLGPGTRMGHFSYIGDANIGAEVNIGAGTVTVNFDGVNKNKTIVGDNAFIGSDTMLIAPVTVEQNARTAAGSVVTRDVPEGHIAIGVPARLRQLNPSPENENGSGE
ncbi:MAG: bifunctional UDP-N-acetylglucosamine diphosphorylase/glucosamine-1-phosphate N-acetyltransferase GlmU [Chloroflexota bacterium]